MLFIIGVMQLGSAFKSARLEVGGMLVHPYLLLLVPVGLFYLSLRFSEVPRRLLGRAVLFMAAIAMMTIPGGWTISLAARVGAWLLTAAAAFALTRTRADYLAGVLGMAVGIGVMGGYGLSEVAKAGGTDAYGVNPMAEVGTKNNYSMYAAPAVFLALGIFLLPWVGTWPKVVAAASSVAMVTVVFGSANRSGWVTMLAIPLLLLAGRAKLRVLLAGGIIAAAVWSGVNQLHLKQVFTDRLAQTQAGYSSDDLRLSIYGNGLWIFLESPLVGALPWEVNFELAKRTAIPSPHLGTHSVVVLLLAGFGLVGTIPFLLLATEYFRAAGVDLRSGFKGLRQRPTSHLVAGLGIVWVIRGLFTDEVLWAPCFGIGFGLLLALATIERRRIETLHPSLAAISLRSPLGWQWSGSRHRVGDTSAGSARFDADLAIGWNRGRRNRPGSWH